MVEDDVILSTIEENRDNLQKTAKALIRALELAQEGL